MAPVTPPKKPIPNKKGEEKTLMAKLMPWILIVLGVGAIAAMVHFSPPEKRLNCRTSAGGTSLTGFGSCTTE